MPSFRHRLTPAQQRKYDRSNAITSIPLRVSDRLARAAGLLELRLTEGDHARTSRLAQIVCDEVCLALRVSAVEVVVKGVRPIKRQTEYHGLYVSDSRTERDTIHVWMFTAKRGQVVAFKTFLRTLLHEVGHHLDYTLLKLGDSFHTDGFFKRESSLVHQILRARVSPAGHRAGTATPGTLRLRPRQPRS
jgi:hypothetical protein